MITTTCFICHKNDKICDGNRPCNHCKEDGHGSRCIGNEVIHNAKVREFEENNFKKDDNGNLVQIVKTPLLPPTSTLLPMPTGIQPMFILEDEMEDEKQNNSESNDNLSNSISFQNSSSKQSENDSRRRRGRPKGSKNKKTKEQKELEEKLNKQKKREEKEKMGNDTVKSNNTLHSSFSFSQYPKEYFLNISQEEKNNIIENINNNNLFNNINTVSNNNFTGINENSYPSLFDSVQEMKDLNDIKRRKGDKKRPISVSVNQNVQSSYNISDNNNFREQIMISSTQGGMTNEIHRLTQRQRELEEEMLSLKMENMKLKGIANNANRPNNNISNNANNNQPNYLNHNPNDGTTTMSNINQNNTTSTTNKNNQLDTISAEYIDKAMVVYDLSKKPPIVISATPMFYQLLNYDKEDVLNQPWYTFIAPDYIDNTTKKLRANSETILTMLQNYVRNDGQAFFSNDVHTFFYGPNGDAILDVVILHPVTDIKTSGGNSNTSNSKNNIQTQDISYLEVDPSTSEDLLFTPPSEFGKTKDKLSTSENLTPNFLQQQQSKQPTFFTHSNSSPSLITTNTNTNTNNHNHNHLGNGHNQQRNGNGNNQMGGTHQLMNGNGNINGLDFTNGINGINGKGNLHGHNNNNNNNNFGFVNNNNNNIYNNNNTGYPKFNNNTVNNNNFYNGNGHLLGNSNTNNYDDYNTFNFLSGNKNTYFLNPTNNIHTINLGNLDTNSKLNNLNFNNLDMSNFNNFNNFNNFGNVNSNQNLENLNRLNDLSNLHTLNNINNVHNVNNINNVSNLSNVNNVRNVNNTNTFNLSGTTKNSFPTMPSFIHGNTNTTAPTANVSSTLGSLTSPRDIGFSGKEDLVLSTTGIDFDNVNFPFSPGIVSELHGDLTSDILGTPPLDFISDDFILESVETIPLDK